MAKKMRLWGVVQASALSALATVPVISWIDFCAGRAGVNPCLGAHERSCEMAWAQTEDFEHQSAYHATVIDMQQQIGAKLCWGWPESTIHQLLHKQAAFSAAPLARP